MEKVIENNILLADFLDMLTTDSEGNIKEDINSLQFHRDFNWLMLVVNKIETLETKDKRTFTIDMHMDSVLIFEYALTTNEVVFTEGQGRFKNLYNACVQFVKWYNEKN